VRDSGCNSPGLLGIFGLISGVPKSRAIGHRGLGQPCAAKVEKISDRTKAGMARARAKGIRISRPKLGIELRQQIAKRAAKGQTPYAIAKSLGIDRHTAAKYAV
jgi:hypothetical protein